MLQSRALPVIFVFPIFALFDSYSSQADSLRISFVVFHEANVPTYARCSSELNANRVERIRYTGNVSNGQFLTSGFDLV